MIEASTIADETPLPAAPAGWFDYSYAALMDDRLALVRLRRDFRAEYARWSQEVSKGNHKIPRPTLRGEDIRLSVFDGMVETDVVIVPSGVHPLIDRTVDGRWTVASARAGEGETNGRIYSARGDEEQAIVLGDGIEHLLCAPDGTLWVGYFDEGVVGGWHDGGRSSVSAGGIVQFDAKGRVLWSFNDQEKDGHVVLDCYAMTLVGNMLWSCFYTGFPIARVDRGKVTFWPNAVAGAKAIAVADNMVLLAGGYAGDEERIAVVKIDGATSHQIGELRFSATVIGSADLVQGRGGILHIVRNGVWSKLSVYDAALAVGQPENEGP
ncbi:MAG: hypothetical protein ABIS51_20715 [Sphingomonas sp.]